jgi:acetyl-CoA synthetase
MSGFEWEPSEDFLLRSNAAGLINRLGFSGYDELIAAWRARPEWFWSQIADDLNLEWREPCEHVLDLSGGVETARWFTGGSMNVAWNCVDRHSPERLALVHESEDGTLRTISYGELRRLVDGLARGLVGLGVGRGDRVGLFLPLVPEAVAALYACAKLGAIAVPLFSGFGAEAVASRLRAAEAGVLLCADGFARRGRVVPMKATADAAVAAVPSLRHVVVLDYVSGSPSWVERRDRRWADVAADAAPFEPEWVPGDDPFLLVYTSGTTAAPKGALHRQAGFTLKVASEVVYHLDYRPGDLLFWVTDVGWIMAPLTLLGAGLVGGTCFLYDGAVDHPSVERLWETIARSRVTIFGVSPTLIRSLMGRDTPPCTAHDLSSLRVLASTGEPWNPSPWRWFLREVGGSRCPIVNIAGGTECGSILGVLPIRPLRACSFNSTCVGVDAAVVDQEGHGLRNGIGELVVRQPFPGRIDGFWRDEDRYLETYWSSWPGLWRHGDWASVDDEGYWLLHGRSDDTLMVAGKRVGPAEVESILVAHPEVLEAAVVGLPEETKGEEIWCFCVLRAPSAASAELELSLARSVARTLGKPFSPAAVRFVKALPHTRNGKLMRRAVRAAALGSEAGDLSALENPDALGQVAAAVATR